MANVSGSVLFNVINSSPTTGNAILSVPVVLRNTLSGLGLSVLTDASGTFTFNNVPNGTYTLVEAWGTTIPSVATPGDFNTAVVIPAPIPQDPPVGAVPSPPPTTNAIQSLSPNTLNLTVIGPDLTGQNFVDGPVSNVPLPLIADIIPFGPNLITSADNGTWGTLPAGSPVNSSPITTPYPGVVPGFTYVQTSPGDPNDGFYSVSNIDTFSTFNAHWFNFADHTSRDETGRTLIINGSNPGALIFNETIPVTPDRYIILNLWVMNVNPVDAALPQLGARLVTTGGSTIYDQILTNVDITTIPTWVQQGTPLFTGSNSSLIFQIYSNGPAANGNDYLIDDISIRNSIVATIVNTTKTVSNSIANVGDNLTYTTVLTNNGQSTASDIIFIDTIPGGTTFVPGSVQINGITFPALDPTPPGFTITLPSSLGPGSTMTINFNVTVNQTPSPNPIVNSSQTSYGFVPIPGGATISQTLMSNDTSTQINFAAFLNMSKSVNQLYAECGDIITYTISLPNNGNVTATNVIVSDTLPNGTNFVPNSVTVNGALVPGANIETGVTIPNIVPGGISTVTFQVQVSC